ncbi:MAG: PQQ-dependent sugar dehydrogenase [Phycisphaerae bacterium]
MIRIPIRAIVVGALGASLLAGATAAVAQPLTSERVASGLSLPCDVTAPPGDFARIFVVEQRSGTTGRIRIVELATNTLLAQPFLSIANVAFDSEQGLLGLAFHPNYASNGYFFVNYTAADGATNIVRYTVSADPNLANPSTQMQVLRLTQPFPNHNGGWLAFGPDGYLYIGMGDGGSANDPGNRAQDITSQLLGKILRIDVDGDDFPADATRNYRIPPTNPFVGVSGDDEIWAFGVRNPWRNAFDRATGDLYIADVGQDVIEEIDFQPANVPGTLPGQAGYQGGKNYGWRCMEGNNCTGLTGCTCNGANLTLPIYTYSHGGGRCSVTGGSVYRGCQIPALQGTYFFADFCTSEIWSFRYSPGTGVTEFTTRTAELDPPGALAINNPSSFGEDARGEVYICDRGGEVFRIRPVTISPDCNGNGLNDGCEGDLAPVITTQPDSRTVCAGDNVSFTVVATGTGLSYQWQRNGVNIGGATSATLNLSGVTTAEAGDYRVIVSSACGSRTSNVATLTVRIPGDANCDGAVVNFDIDAFVLGLTGGQAAWEAVYNCGFHCALDINGDGSVNNFDIDPFVALLTGP